MNTNNQLIEIIMTLVQNWKWLLLSFLLFKAVKFGLQTYLQIMTIRYSNKDSFSVRMDNNSKEISISTSQKIKIDEIERALSAPNSNVLEIDFKKDKAS